jgi:predicted NBD/HSP70 family sugar kinase
MAERYCDRKGVPHLTYSGEEVFKLAKEGDEDAICEVETFHKYLSIGLFNLQMSFDPEVIVIGGGISSNAEIITNLEARVNNLLKNAHIKDFKATILPCRYKNDANLLGAVKNFYDRMEANR